MSQPAQAAGQQGPALQLHVADKLAVITFDQPGSRANTLGLAVLAEFEQTIDRVAQLPDVQGLVLRSGKPGMFIAGADLRELGQAAHDVTNAAAPSTGLGASRSGPTWASQASTSRLAATVTRRAGTRLSTGYRAG